MIPTGYREDGQGTLVPISKIKPEALLEDELVQSLVERAEAIQAQLQQFKSEAFAEVQALRDLVASEYGAKVGGAKGNCTLRTFDGKSEVSVQISDHLQFGPGLQAAKSLIDECIEDWAAGSNDNLRALVNHAFQVNKEGRIDTGRVLALRQLDIEAEKWQRAMDAISDAVRVTHSTPYVRIYKRDPETGERTPISLNVAKL